MFPLSTLSMGSKLILSSNAPPLPQTPEIGSVSLSTWLPWNRENIHFRAVKVVMALSIAYMATYVNGQNKLTKQSEAAVESGRVLKFVFDREYRVIKSSVQASMRDTSYKVQVSALHMYPPRSCHFAVQMFISSLNCIIVCN